MYQMIGALSQQGISIKTSVHGDQKKNKQKQLWKILMMNVCIVGEENFSSILLGFSDWPNN